MPGSTCSVTPNPASIGAALTGSATGLYAASPAALTVTWHDDTNSTADLIYTNAPYPEQTGPFVDAQGDLAFAVPSGWTAPATANRGTVQITTWNSNGKFKYAFCEFVITA
jgi:hypothetical protein